jgi:hypothetical protein
VAPLLFVGLNVLVLPHVLQRIMVLRGTTSASGVHKGTCRLFFLFQLVFFLFSCLWNTAFGPVLAFLMNDTRDLPSIWNLASAGFVTQSTYFITFIVVGLSNSALEIIQLARIAKVAVRSLLRRLTARELAKFHEPPRFRFTLVYGTLLLNILVALCYSVVAPLILPFACLQFLMASGGSFFPGLLRPCGSLMHRLSLSFPRLPLLSK